MNLLKMYQVLQRSKRAVCEETYIFFFCNLPLVSCHLI
ncbi:hypothetical protein F383_03364 [Gossypium arboreum]|uniref:Uncharacterized protein n=1 Tax=Gossypium arboreum TaxID=29729 RepID=A0A0B0P6M2_GOSAR|nr:hypothetical protein F383_03364 [Gossypium arboreum]